MKPSVPKQQFKFLTEHDGPPSPRYGELAHFGFTFAAGMFACFVVSRTLQNGQLVPADLIGCVTAGAVFGLYMPFAMYRSEWRMWEKARTGATTEQRLQALHEQRLRILAEAEQKRGRRAESETP